ncbi:hypothetical protein Cfor_05416 [Coptotermes formosanus]|uniref:Uncharacterized protein n=1 Tax=Coptotermes formosanus TaxID=36987 RepID=A0A6L2PWT7_COPFO|nr:hypothetical protein Cfor_05416 [Coptotermes formosanus]
MEVTQTQDLIDKIKIIRTENKKFPAKKKRMLRLKEIATQKDVLQKYSNLQKTFEVSGIVMPGSRLQATTHFAKREINSLTKEGVVVIWGGANDINKSESIIRPTHIKNVVVNWKHTNIVMMNALHSHDIPATSCINKEVQDLKKTKKTPSNKT